MPETAYINLRDINELQKKIMRFVGVWVHTKKTPIPLKEILKEMVGEGINVSTTTKAINALLRKRYIRRACMIGSSNGNKSYFVQIRSVPCLPIRQLADGQAGCKM